MKRFKKTVCAKCNRDIRSFEQPRTYEGRIFCLECNETLLQHAPVALSVKARYAPYGWLKVPALLLGGIGVLGILMDRFEGVAAELSFLNMPPAASCYVTAVGAMILLGLSILYKQSKEKIALDERISQRSDKRWRSV